MIFESIALNVAVLIILIVALSLDYLTKFFSYWYVRFIPYKTPVPAFGSDYERVLGVSGSVDVANHLYSKYPKDKYVGYIKSRIPELIVRDPEIIKLILTDDFDNFRNRGLSLDRSADYSLKNNLFFAENELWSALRPRLQTFFESEAAVSRAIGNASGLIQQSLPTISKECNVRELANDLTTLLVCECLFDNETLTPADRKLLSQITERLRRNSFAAKIKNYIMSIFPSLYVMFNMSRLENNLVQSLKKTISRITQKLVDGTFLQFLHKQKEGGPMDVTPEGKRRKQKPRTKEFDEDMVASQIISLIGEGLVPCSNVVAAALYELAKAPDVLASVQREVDHLPEDRLHEGKILGGVVDEVLRLYPPYSLLHRVCVSLYKIPNTTIVIDKGVTVAIPVAAIHKDAAYYKHPERFDPSRFNSEEAQKRHPYTYLPFGAGPRCCIGERVARRWLCACVGAVLRTHAVSPAARTPRALALAHGAFSSALQHDLWLTVAPRRPH